MFVILILTACISVVASQNTTLCECSVWAKDSRPGEREHTLVAYVGSGDFDADECDAASIEETECYQACWTMGENFVTGSGVCGRHWHEEKEVCYGNLWCERIASNNPGWNAEGEWELSARVLLRDCFGNDWAEIENPNGTLTLCCDRDNAMDQCNEEDCTCDIPNQNDCECGVFIPEMFDEEHIPHPHLDPLPLSFVGDAFDGDDWEADCINFPNTSNPEVDFCSNNCVERSDDLLGYSLSDPHPNNPSVTYGQMMCAGLFAKVNNYTEFTDASLNIYGRVKDCPDGTSRWQNEDSFGVLDETLCCDEQGTWSPCQLFDDLFG